MITQRVSPKKVGAWQGILMVLAIAALLMTATALVNVLKARTDPIWGQIGVLLLAGLGAYYLMRNYVLEYQYTVADGVFYIERIYGQRTKVMLQVPLGDILFVGEDRQAAAKWPQARVMVNATLGRPMEKREKVCFAYRKDGQVQLGLIQADEAIRKALYDEERRAAQAKEKWG